VSVFQIECRCGCGLLCTIFRAKRKIQYAKIWDHDLSTSHWCSLLVNEANKDLSSVLWAQRSSATDAEKNYLYVTITVPDVQAKNLKLDIKPTSVKFAGHSDSLKKDYAIELELYAEIDEGATKVNHTAKNVQLVLRKKEMKEEFWPRLLKEAKKAHFLKTDFDKWVDEDEQDEAPEDDLGEFHKISQGNQSKLTNTAAAGGPGGMGGMPGMGDMSSMMGGAGGDFGGIDFSKLGGAGMGGEEEGDEGEDDDDEDMPELEEPEEASSSSKPTSKIEEIN
jgi:hypothetical protein